MSYLSLSSAVIAANPLTITPQLTTAIAMLNQLTTAASTFVEKLTSPATEICPYQQVLNRYVGNYTSPSIWSIQVPQTFEIQTVLPAIENHSTKLIQESFNQYSILAKQLADPEQNINPALGNAFAVLSGNDYVIDEIKLSNHLKFNELIKSIPFEDIKKHPYEIARTLLYVYSQII